MVNNDLSLRKNLCSYRGKRYESILKLDLDSNQQHIIGLCGGRQFRV